MALTYDADTHQYFLGGERILGITETLREVGLVGEFGTPDDLRRGSEVHEWCRRYDEGACRLDEVPEAYRGYVASWAKFLAVSGFVSDAIEIAVASVTHRFAGRPDRIGHDAKGRLIVEIKSGRPQPWTALQTAAQDLADREMNGVLLPGRRIAVEVKADGSQPTIVEYDAHTDLNIFLCALAVAQWKRAH